MLVRVLILLLLGVFDIALFGKMIWGPGGIVEYQTLKNEYKTLQEKLSELDAENIALSREIRLLQSDDRYVEKIVREKLRYLRDNEMVYLFPSPSENKTGAIADGNKN